MNKKVVILILVVLVLIMIPIGSYLKEQITIKKISSSNKPDETISEDYEENFPLHVEPIKDDPNVETVNIDGFEIPVDYKFVEEEKVTSSPNISISKVVYKTKGEMTKIDAYFTNNTDFPINSESKFVFKLVAHDDVHSMDTSLDAFLVSGDTLLKGEKGVVSTQFLLPIENLDSITVHCDNYNADKLKEVLNQLLSSISGDSGEIE